MTDPARSRAFSGEVLRAVLGGEGVFLLIEFARSAIDGPGDREATRTLAFLTEKNAGVLPGVGPVDGGGAELPPENFSNAFILAAMPEPTLTFLVTGLFDS